MTQEQAEALVAGQKIQYWDGRIATVTQVATTPASAPPPLTGLYPTEVKFVTVKFDAEAGPKPIYEIKTIDFVRAEPL